MIRRILVIGSIGLALAGGARFALHELAERAWEKRRQALLAEALFQPELRRPWEIRFDALQERMRSSPRFAEIRDSAYRPHTAWGAGEPRALNDFEKVWVESAWGELDVLDSILEDLRALAPRDLAWSGPTVGLLSLRECTNALCARAWIALEDDDQERMARAYSDALRLARATDDGTAVGTAARSACEGIALRSVRSALALGASAGALRAALTPLLADWTYTPERGERCIRRDLAILEDFHPEEGESGAQKRRECDSARAWLAPVEKALRLAREPVARTPWACKVHSQVSRDRNDDDMEHLSWDSWTLGIKLLHERHAVRNVVLTALSVAAFHTEHDAWPASLSDLDDLPAEHALDTLTGAPLPYTLEANGARVGPASFCERTATWQGEGEPVYVWTLR